MACNICSFNLAELCATTVALMKDPKHDISTTMPAPDFVGGGQILYDEAQMREVYENGRGSIKVRARYNVVPGENMLEITQIPPTTTVEAIMDKIAELVKAGKIKEISDMRDETDLNGLKLTLDLKRGVDPVSYTHLDVYKRQDVEHLVDLLAVIAKAAQSLNR